MCNIKLMELKSPAQGRPHSLCPGSWTFVKSAIFPSKPYAIGAYLGKLLFLPCSSDSKYKQEEFPLRESMKN